MIFQITASSLSAVRHHLNIKVRILKRMKCEIWLRFSDSLFSELRCELARASRQPEAETTSAALIFPEYGHSRLHSVHPGSVRIKGNFPRSTSDQTQLHSNTQPHLYSHSILHKDAIYSTTRSSPLLHVDWSKPTQLYYLKSLGLFVFWPVFLSKLPYSQSLSIRSVIPLRLYLFFLFTEPSTLTCDDTTDMGGGNSANTHTHTHTHLTTTESGTKKEKKIAKINLLRSPLP